MFEKKNLIINCDVCDARKVKEETLSGYEHIIINTDLLLVNERSKEAFAKFPIICNMISSLELDEEVNCISENGHYEIAASTAVASNTVLAVNGDLVIHPGTQEVLQSFLAFSVNGSVRCPASLSPYLKNLSVNGSTDYYPDDCIVLDSDFTPDAYFPLRVKEGGRYYVKNRVCLTDQKLDIPSLAAKGIQFVTPSVLVGEASVPDALSLFDETVKLQIIPAGYAYAGRDVRLDQALLAKHGSRLYVEGSLTLDQSSAPLLSRIEGLKVNGTVCLPASLLDAFQGLGAEYENLTLLKGKVLQSKPMATINASLLNACPDGLSVRSCALVRIAKDVSPEQILEKTQFESCASIFCSEEQKSAVELVSNSVAFIGAQEEKEAGGGIGDMLGNLLSSRVVNADLHVL